MVEIPGILNRCHSRRQFLQAGAFGSLAGALNQSRLLATPKAARPIRSCIMLMLYGGPSHLDTWDMKPDAPTEIRGEYQPIRTSVPGLRICEHLGACAPLMNRFALIRSVHHDQGNHNPAVYHALVGRPPTSNEPVLGQDRFHDFPGLGSQLSYGLSPEARAQVGPLLNVALPHLMHNVVDLPGQNAGFLGGRHDPFQINSDPSAANFRVRNLTPSAELAAGRITERDRLRDSLAQAIPAINDAGFDAYRERALGLMQDQQIQNAFRMDREKTKIRDRYGRHKLAQSLLLARRLTEAGVRFINVYDGVRNGQNANWDSHLKIFPRHRQLLASLNQGLSALIRDLEQRGLLESTLVVVMGEFGRSPRINKNAGRDHWPQCYTVALAGGGIQGGSFHGSSDRIGAYPDSSPVTPGDLAATVLWRFGVDLKQNIHDQQDRPIPLANGSPIRSVFSS